MPFFRHRNNFYIHIWTVIYIYIYIHICTPQVDNSIIVFNARRIFYTLRIKIYITVSQMTKGDVFFFLIPNQGMIVYHLF